VLLQSQMTLVEEAVCISFEEEGDSSYVNQGYCRYVAMKDKAST